MDAKTLRWLQQVPDGVTVTKVADLYMFSQPAASRALARLKEAAGAPLLLKRACVLRTTHAGSAFRHHIDSFRYQPDDALAAVGE
jgi:DNA-binding transcriptional LysR family regulator